MSRFAFGIELPASYSSKKDEDDDINISTSIAFAPFLRYYFGTSVVKPYIHGEAGIRSRKIKYDPAMGASIDESYGMFLYEVDFGIGIFLNERVSLDIGLGYASVSVKPRENNDINYRSISSGIGLNIGFIVIL